MLSAEAVTIADGFVLIDNNNVAYLIVVQHIMSVSRYNPNAHYCSHSRTFLVSRRWTPVDPPRHCLLYTTATATSLIHA